MKTSWGQFLDCYKLIGSIHITSPVLLLPQINIYSEIHLSSSHDGFKPLDEQLATSRKRAIKAHSATEESGISCPRGKNSYARSWEKNRQLLGGFSPIYSRPVFTSPKPAPQLELISQQTQKGGQCLNENEVCANSALESGGGTSQKCKQVK